MWCQQQRRWGARALQHATLRYMWHRPAISTPCKPQPTAFLPAPAPPAPLPQQVVSRQPQHRLLYSCLQSAAVQPGIVSHRPFQQGRRTLLLCLLRCKRAARPTLMPASATLLLLRCWHVAGCNRLQRGSFIWQQQRRSRRQPLCCPRQLQPQPVRKACLGQGGRYSQEQAQDGQLAWPTGFAVSTGQSSNHSPSCLLQRTRQRAERAQRVHTWELGHHAVRHLQQRPARLNRVDCTNMKLCGGN